MDEPVLVTIDYYGLRELVKRVVPWDRWVDKHWISRMVEKRYGLLVGPQMARRMAEELVEMGVLVKKSSRMGILYRRIA